MWLQSVDGMRSIKSKDVSELKIRQHGTGTTHEILAELYNTCRTPSTMLIGEYRNLAQAKSALNKLTRLMSKN